MPTRKNRIPTRKIVSHVNLNAVNDPSIMNGEDTFAVFSDKELVLPGKQEPGFSTGTSSERPGLVATEFERPGPVRDVPNPEFEQPVPDRDVEAPDFDFPRRMVTPAPEIGMCKNIKKVNITLLD